MINLVEIEKKLRKSGLPPVKLSEKNGAVRLEGEFDNYDDIVDAGRLAVHAKNSRGVINDIKLKNYKPKPMRVPNFSDKLYDNVRPDVLIVGGGVVGCAIARELSHYKLDVMLCEKEYDVATAQSSRNDGMIHAGIDLKPSSLKVKYNMRGNQLYDTVSKQLNLPIDKCGQCVLFTAPWQKFIYPIIKLRGKINGIPTRLLSNKGVADFVPKAGLHNWGFFCPGAGLVSPYLATVAFAENAAENGVKICLNTAVLDIENDGERVLSVTTNRGKIYPKVLINAAGVFSDIIAEKAGDRFFTIHPRKGVEAVIDNKATTITKSVVGRFAIKTSTGKSHSKGGGVIRTVDGNLLIGPNVEEVIEREDESTTAESLADVYEKQALLTPNLKKSDIITYFAGTRAATYEETFIVEKSPVIKNLVQAAGIQSPGLTAAPAIAVDVAKWTAEILSATQKVEKNEQFNPLRKGIPTVRELSDEDRNALIRQNPDYGVVICRCEQITKGEIVDAIHSPIPCDTLDGIKRRVRAGMGRCQGGFCSPLVTKIIAEERNQDLLTVTKKGQGSEVLTRRTKEGN